MSAISRELETWEREPFAHAAPAIDDLRRRCAACPPARVLSAAAANALPAEEQAAVAAHVESCGPCAALQADFDLLEPVTLDPSDAESLLSRIRREARPARQARWSRWTVWLPVSMATATALLAIVFARPVKVAAPAASAPNAQAAGPAEAAPTPPAAVPVPELEKPAVRLTMLALTWRNGAEPGGFAEAVAPALDAFRADRYADADEKLAALADRYPSSVEVPFYQGVSRLFLGRNQEAVEPLRRARRLADETFAADASWYLGIALARSGHSAEAHLRFAALCRGKSAYAARACEAAR